MNSTNQRRIKERLSVLLAAMAIITCPLQAQAADANTLNEKIIFGYQGWYGCPGDFDGNKFWQHWFVGSIDPKHFTVDLLPATHGMNQQALCDTKIPTRDGQGTVKVFSSLDPRTTETHFEWMRTHQVDGVAVQRFIAGMADPEKKRRSDRLLQNVQSAAEKNGRVFYVAYDVSGAPPETVTADIRSDWQHIANDLKLTSSKSYLRDNGKPVLELWGFGFSDRPGAPAEVLSLIDDLKAGKNGLPAATMIGGVPTNWRTLKGDSKSDLAWKKIYASYDVLSPWSVGRYSDEATAKKFVADITVPDIAATRAMHVRYMPVVSPGFSWFNLMTNRSTPDHAVLNRVPRLCGNFLWTQIRSELDAGATMLYGAMFDEMDEATSMLPTVTRDGELPAGGTMLNVDSGSCSLPDDAYLQLMRRAGRHLRDNHLPLADDAESALQHE